MFKRKKNKVESLYEVVEIEDNKKAIRLTSASKFKGVVFKLTGIDYDGTEPIVNYDVLECPKKFKLETKDQEKFSAVLEKVLSDMLQNAAKAAELKEKELENVES